MKRFHLSILVAVCASVGVQAQTTPLTEPLEEQKEALITCELTQAPKHSEMPMVSTAKQCEEAKGIYHYRLWLPAGYKADQSKAWPCIFIASPGGNAGMGNMADWLKASGYVVVMMVESKNGKWAPCVGNFLSAHDDVVKRIRIQEGLKIATGMSGGARDASVNVQMRPGFAGLILQAAGAAQDDKGNYYVAKLKGAHAIFVAMTMGESDSNKKEVARMKALLGSSRFLAFPFDGGHGWAPTETFEKAITWVEQQIYRKSDSNAAVKKLLQARCGQAAPPKAAKAGEGVPEPQAAKVVVEDEAVIITADSKKVYKTGSWQASSQVLFETRPTVFTREPGATAKFRLDFRSAARAAVSIYMTADGKRYGDPHMKVTVVHKGKEDAFELDCTKGVTEWHELGVFDFGGAGHEYVLVTRISPDSDDVATRAIAVKSKLVPLAAGAK